jgi:SAM-dependent methyltransferase
MTMLTTERFTGRVENYRLHRPRYPQEIVDLFLNECDLTADKQIADIAAGTGLLSEIFLQRHYSVIAVEPNDEMRTACNQLVEQFPRLHCVPGTAKTTGLPTASVDCVLVGQAMHWFDLKRTREEFVRILRLHGWCAVIYNNRRMEGDPFHEGYERILREFGIDYTQVQERHLSSDEIERRFFAPTPARRKAFANLQELSLEALEGRILSSSYMPKQGQARHEEMREAIATLFSQHQENGRVRLEYECVVTYGQLNS